MSVVGAMYPAGDLQKAIKSRFQALRLGLGFDDIAQFVHHRLASLDPDMYLPTLAREQVCRQKKLLPRGGDQVLWRTNSREIGELETAYAYYLAVIRLEVKPTAHFLRKAWHHLSLADEIHARRKASRSQGGIKRHSKNSAAKDAVIKDLKSRAHSLRGLTESKAAKAIAPQVAAVIREYRLSIVAADNLPRTIRRWLKHDPDITAVWMSIQLCRG